MTFNRIIEIQLMYLLLFKAVEDDRSGRYRKGVVAGIGNHIVKVHDRIEAHTDHLTIISLLGSGIGQRSPIGNFAHILWERDGEILQAVHLALGRVDGDLLIKRFHIAFDIEPERQRQQTLTVDDNRCAGQVQEIMT